MGQVGFHRTVPLVLHETGGIGQTHRTEDVGGTGGIGWTHRNMVVELHRYGTDIPIFDGKYLPIPITDLIFHIPYFLKYKPGLLFLLSKSDQATNRRQAFNRARRLLQM